jgi:hypothetical protein
MKLTQWAEDLKIAGFQKKYKTAHIPSLSDLIEACGDKFYGLDFHIGFEIKWLAEGLLDDDTIIGEGGKSPSEAVAKLWLELNKNNK